MLKGSPSMKIIFDTNVLLDILARRQPFVAASFVNSPVEAITPEELLAKAN